MFVHVDCDDFWLYRSEYGTAGGDDASRSVYDHALPRLLQAVESQGVRATLFVVARDLERPGVGDTATGVLRGALERGHAVANHSYGHSASFAEQSDEERQRDVTRAHEVLATRLGTPLMGFRGPGYYFDRGLRDLLVHHGYRYDGSRYPGWTPAAMRLATRRKGSNKDVGALPSNAYSGMSTWSGTGVAPPGLVSVPILTLTPLQLPTHTTAQHAFGPAYARLVRAFVARGSGRGVFLLHALDGVDAAEAPDLAMLPTLQRPLEWRLGLVRDVLRAATGQGHVVTTEQALAGVR